MSPTNDHRSASPAAAAETEAALPPDSSAINGRARAEAAHDSLIADLNILIETCRDGERGYLAAARDVRNHDLKTLCTGLATQRREFHRDLTHLLRDLREVPARRGTALGTLHRGWLHFRAALTSGDESAILSECERGDETAVARYREVLHRSDLPPEIYDLLRLQCMGVEGAHTHLREIRFHFDSGQHHHAHS